jgi:hypothetical protein
MRAWIETGDDTVDLDLIDTLPRLQRRAAAADLGLLSFTTILC